MKWLIAVLVVFTLATSAEAMSEMQIKEKWSGSLVAVKKEICKDEVKRMVLNKLDYAAVLIMHNEIEEAKTAIKQAASNAKSADCVKAIEKNINPPGGEEL